MKAQIANFRKSRTRQKDNHMIVLVEGTDSKAKAEKLVGKKVIFTTEGKAKKQIVGKVASAHGNKGAVRVIFERGMPGQAIGKEVKIE
ncbi:50S ribosomal protein L35ae [Candidatus Woesearchaeota archaeon]|nr:50S ribosomal protein L35ae [Candidatus Woesearchaeota archaeon]